MNTPMNAPTQAQREILDRLVSIARQVRQMMPEIADGVKSLPDNPEIVSRSAQGRSFVIRSSALSGRNGVSNWTPFHHDWRAQYERISEIILEAASDPKSAAWRLRGVLSKYSDPSARNLSSGSYAPEVVRNATQYIEFVLEICDSLVAKNLTPTALRKEQDSSRKSLVKP